MIKTRLFIAVAALVAFAGVGIRSASAQAVTTGSVSGTVTSADGQPVEGAQVRVVNRNTGFTAGVTTGRTGRYNISGLEVGGNYSITARAIGFEPQTRENLVVSLSQAARLDFAMTARTVQLAGVTVVAETSPIISPSHTGTMTAITDSALRRLPTLDRNFTDFVALTPQVSTTLFNGGLSGGGTNNRYNNVQIDGTSEADVFGLGSTGQPGGQANGKSIGLEAVKEYTVSLSPFDVRQGFFAGLLINAVTKSGTNDFHGSAFATTRNEGLTRSQPYISEYSKTQYGLSVGGPIVKNKAFFFISPEFQTRTGPASGIYLGQSGVNLTSATANQFINTLKTYGLSGSGTFGLVNNENPLQNIFARVDINLPYNSQLVLRHNYAHSQDDNFSRGTSSFRLSNNGYFFDSKKQAPAMQLRTLFANGSYNEFLAGYTQIRDRRTPRVKEPEISVIVPGYTLVSGAERFSHGNELDQDILEVTENFTMPMGLHRITIGTQNEFQKFRNLFAQSTFGVWSFDSMDDFTSGKARSYTVGVPLQANSSGTVQPGGDGAVRFSSVVYSLYAQDEWSATPRLNLTLGLRADMPVFNDKPPTNPSVLASYNRNTADIPSGNVQWSPRVGFNWDVTGDAANQVRGGLGLFTGRPAYVWLANAFQSSGMGGVAVLTCSGSATSSSAPPVFNSANASNPPSACGGGQTPGLGAEIDLLDPNLKYPQNLRGTLGFDHRFPSKWVSTLEVLYTQGVNGLFYNNAALAGPRGVNSEGRTVYGTQPFSPTLKAGGRSQIFDVTNQSNDHAISVTAGLSRRWSDSFEGSLFYTNTHAYDVQSFTSSTAFSQLRFGRVTGGDLLDQSATRSTFEQRHRLVGQATWTMPSKTDISVIYFGESGSPYTYITSGDLNADGLSLNDPIYIPKNAAQEMTFLTSTFGGVSYTPAQQAAAYDEYILGSSCLSRNRGGLMPRNACTNPFTNTFNVSARQSFKTMGMQHVTLELGIFNFLNLINKSWGAQPSVGTSPITLLTSGNYVGGDALTGKTTYRFNPGFTKLFSDNLRSNYQMQLQARYSF